jgi:hypothetical protein
MMTHFEEYMSMCVVEGTSHVGWTWYKVLLHLVRKDLDRE